MSELSEEMLAEKVPGVKPETLEFAMATVGAVTADGLRLIFPGEDAASDKVYKCNAGVKFETGDRVKVSADSGTFLVDYCLGAPMARYPIPVGGTDGQILTKDGSGNFAVKWANRPSSGLPIGGTDGQVLTKNGATDYAVKWADIDNPLPTGGSTGQVLKKTSAANYAVSWGDVSATVLGSGTYTLTLNTSGVLLPSRSNSMALGSSSYAFGDLYANGTIKLGDYYSGSVLLGGSSAKLGFFGTTPRARQSVASSATVATLITALKNYGLFS